MTSKRLTEIDAMRGLAISLILFVHLNMFEALYIDVSLWSGVDYYTAFTVSALGHGKLYGLFSILFGLGAVWLMAGRGRVYWLRRMLILSIIGLVHRIIWPGDILLAYGVIGLAVVPHVWDWSSRKLGGLVLALLSWPILFYAALGGSVLQGWLTVTQGGGGTALWLSVLTWWPQVAAMILLGVIVGRAGWGLLVKRAGWWPLLLGLGVPLAVVQQWLTTLGGGPALLGSMVGVVAGAWLSCGYMLLALWVWQKRGGARVMAFFGPVGRMALSVYLLQTVLMLFIFGVWGLSLRPVEAVIGAAVYGLAIAVICHAWLSVYRHGPVEAAWRRLAGWRMVTDTAAAAE